MSPSIPPEPDNPPIEPNASIESNARYQSALAFLYDRINYEKMASGTARYPFRLHRTGELLRRLGLHGYLADEVTQPAVPIVHIAGTKGKGSTASMVASILTSAGFRTGLYTSPHLIDLEERFRIDAVACPRDTFADLIDHIAPVVQSLADEDHGEPSFFELTTAIALLHFHTQKCDAIVLEVGLGGRLDSTNVCISSVTAITSIGLDHQHVLGNTLAEIAGEKAGIIKPNLPVVSGVRDTTNGGLDGQQSNDDPAKVIAATAHRHSAPLIQLGKQFDFQYQCDADWGSTIQFRNLDSNGRGDATGDLGPIRLPLEGEHQAHNASLAIAIAQQLRSETDGDPLLAITDDAIGQGLSNVQCPGRIERFRFANEVTVIIDAAHNDDSVKALCRSLAQRRGDRPVAIVFGTSRDKSADSMLRTLAPVADLLVLTRFEGNPRFRATDELLPLVPSADVRKTIVRPTPIQACQAGLDFVTAGGMMVVCGSFFLAAETRGWIQSHLLFLRS